jgi:hypothetical protein
MTKYIEKSIFWVMVSPQGMREKAGPSEVDFQRLVVPAGHDVCPKRTPGCQESELKND